MSYARRRHWSELFSGLDQAMQWKRWNRKCNPRFPSPYGHSVLEGTHLPFSGAAQRQFGLAVRGKANGLIDAPGFASTNNGALLSADSHGKQWFVRTQSLLQAKGRWLAACRATNIERSWFCYSEWMTLWDHLCIWNVDPMAKLQMALFAASFLQISDAEPGPLPSSSSICVYKHIIN